MYKNKKRKGASSVIVLFTIVILITFSFFTIVSANADYRKSLEASEWNNSYYELDSYGESVVAEIDDVLYHAEQDAVHYILTSEFQQKNSKTISQHIHLVNKKIYNNNVNNVYDVLNNTYKSLALEYLKEIEEKYNGDVVALYNKNGGVYSLYYKNDLSLTNKSYILSIKLNIQDILYDVSINNGKFSGRKIDFKNRYLITKWIQSSTE